MKTLFIATMLASLSGFCQHPSTNGNWEKVLNEEFSGNRYWKNNRIDNTNTMRAYFSECGVTHGGKYEHQVYTRENAIFKNGTLVLKAEYNPNTTNFWTGGYDTYYSSYDYLSGAIEFVRQFKYGYFEIRCKLPKANYGNFPAFWLWSGGKRYSEIDVFEHTIWTGEEHKNGYKSFTGSYYDSNVHGHTVVAYQLSDNERPLTEYHTYAVKWLPKSCVWYFDGRIIGEVYEETEIPDEPMLLKANYAIDNYHENSDKSKFPLEMTIDYVRVYQLKCDCSKNVTLSTNAQLSSYQPSVKKHITIKGSEPLKLSKDLSLMATDGVSIESEFEVPIGKEFSIDIVQCTE